MPEPRLIAVLTAIVLLAGTAPLRAAYSLEELREIERLVLAKDSAALGAFLAVNPGITSGDDPLARELRSFQNCLRSGRLECFASPKVVTKVASEPQPDPNKIY